ncbi:hypothetical protein [Dyella caseinilytica]|uniref:DUF3592 domain-containing protein n=1 Tax=Dyella caseinilytica TaxID=1849581 RepID=A0ABX7H075_9GAMM|nr:hypothetical protein [Dyella caseinilytica]QRN55593.1 hypothetical protein ISN74_09845 [Dyella caseinilytica]
MLSKIISYVLLGISTFILAFLALTLVINRYAPTPDVKDFNTQQEMFGQYKYNRASRGGSATWVDNTLIFCGAGAFSFYPCLGHTGDLVRGASVVVKFVKLKTMRRDIPMAMSIKSMDREVFVQTPTQVISAWRIDNMIWFSCFSLSFAALAVGFTYIFRTGAKN